MKKKNFKRVLQIVAMLLLTVMMVSGCGENNNGAKLSEVKTRFATYSQSLCEGQNALDLLFFCTEEDLARWEETNIENIWVKVGETKTETSIMDLTLSENAVYERYYIGYLSVSGDFSESSGEMVLRVQTKSENEIREYDLGYCSVMDTTQSEYADITELLCGGVVKTDDYGNVCTYGIIVHINTANDIHINATDLGLENVGLDIKNHQIYTPEEYRNNIYKSIDEVTFDQYYKDAYVRKTVSDIDNTADITLEKGEYYLYFPVSYTENAPTICQGVLNIHYTTSDGNSKNYISNCFPYFSEFSKSEVVLEMMFEE